jgi:ATP-dependent DNA helicase RecG
MAIELVRGLIRERTGERRRGSKMDWLRLQKALAVEAERGFNDLMGNQYRFSEFLSFSLNQPPSELTENDRQKLQELAAKFSQYGDLAFADRQHLVAESRRILHQTRRTLETAVAPPAKPKTPKTTPLVEPGRKAAVMLDQTVTYLPGIGVKNAEKLAKLGLSTVRDILYYYPRDYMDYARQVSIRDLEPGQTVTLVATVKKCNCFSSPRNAKLTIFELVIKDATGQLKLNRFYPGTRFRSPAWQNQQKRMYPPGAVIAASGLVKQDKYGVSLEDPQIEVIDHSQASIDSMKVGRVVPVYPLTEGVGADVVRKAVVAALPAVVQIQDALPEGLRQKYDLVAIQEAIAHIHFPPHKEGLDRARRRLVFDEFFYLQLGLLKRRMAQRQQQTSATLAPTGHLIDQFYNVLPFKLTGAQQRVVNDILNDLQQPTPMNRLIQGDVGSGKTVVGVVAILAAIQSGYQAALMALSQASRVVQPDASFGRAAHRLDQNQQTQTDSLRTTNRRITLASGHPCFDRRPSEIPKTRFSRD